MARLPDPIRRLLPGPGDSCVLCGRRIGDRDARMRLRGDGVVHQGCATYRMRRARKGSERLGFPPR